MRRFLEDKSPTTEVRRLMETDDGYDPAVWSQMAEPARAAGARSFPRSTAGRVSATWSSSSCSRRWAGRCCARPTSRPSRLPRTRSSPQVTRPPRPTTCPASPAARRSPPWRSPRRRALGPRRRHAGGDRRRRRLDARRHKMYVVDGHTAGLILVAARTARGHQPVRRRR